MVPRSLLWRERVDKKNARLGNMGLFARSERDKEYLASHVDRDAY